MRITINISGKEDKKRLFLWRRFAKVENNKFEFLNSFNRRVFLHGLNLFELERITILKLEKRGKGND